MWTDTSRRQHSRSKLRYPSDLRDCEWALIEALLPPAKPGDWPRCTDLREVMNAILYVATSGCQWRMLPKDFPPLSTVQRYFHVWRDSGLWQAINHLLVMSARQIEGREASPSASNSSPYPTFPGFRNLWDKSGLAGSNLDHDILAELVVLDAASWRLETGMGPIADCGDVAHSVHFDVVRSATQRLPFRTSFKYRN